MAIKTLGSAQKIRVGRESGNTFIFLGLRYKKSTKIKETMDVFCLSLLLLFYSEVFYLIFALKLCIRYYHFLFCMFRPLGLGNV